MTVLNVSRIVTLSRHNTELSARTNADRAEAAAAEHRGGAHSPRRSTRTSSRLVVGAAAGSERADRSADVFVDGVLQPDRGDDSARRDAHVGASVVQGWRDDVTMIGPGQDGRPTSTSSWRSSRRHGTLRRMSSRRQLGTDRRRAAARDDSSSVYVGAVAEPEPASGRRPRLRSPKPRSEARQRPTPARGEVPPPAPAPAGRRAPVMDARRVLTEKRRLILPIAIALLVNVALFAIVVYPLSKKVAGGEQESQAATDGAECGQARLSSGPATVEGQGPGRSGAAEVLQRSPAARHERARAGSRFSDPAARAAVRPSGRAHELGCQNRSATASW